MLNLDDIKFTKTEISEKHPNAYEITGTFTWTGVCIVCHDEDVPMADIKAHIKRKMWGDIYEDLRQPLLELEGLARRYCPDYESVAAVMAKLRAVINPKIS